MSVAEISTVEEAAAFFEHLAIVFPGHRVTIHVRERLADGDVMHHFTAPVRAVHNVIAKRVEIEVEP